MNPSRVLLDDHLAQTTMFPFAIEVDRAEGVYIYDVNGKAYMDLVSGIGVSNLGHGRREIIRAIQQQAEKHLHVMVYGEYIQRAQQDAAQLLTSFLPAELDCCYFVNSGTEANEAAIKLARRVTGRSRILSFLGAYHGNTLGSMSISSNETKKAAFRPLIPDVWFIRQNNFEDLALITEDVAGVFLETIQGDAGVRIPDTAWIQALRERCTQVGALLIFDEIQCGMGRSGTMFAFEQFGVVPDALTLGKALGGGLPVGCLVSSTSRLEQFTHDPMLGHISTFAGHPLICAAVAACLKIYRDEPILSSIEQRGQRIAELMRRQPHVREVRQRGYYFAIDLENAQQVQQVVEGCLADGVITFWFLSCPWSFRIAPPLTISEDELDRACQVISKHLHQIK